MSNHIHEQNRPLKTFEKTELRKSVLKTLATWGLSIEYSVKQNYVYCIQTVCSRIRITDNGYHLLLLLFILLLLYFAFHSCFHLFTEQYSIYKENDAERCSSFYNLSQNVLGQVYEIKKVGLSRRANFVQFSCVIEKLSFWGD